jgi:uncharacterized protein YbcC (UPF0753/DUF2309 family)
MSAATVIPGIDAAAVLNAAEAACARIAPTWPLDRFIAVNPLWERIDRPVAAVAADQAVLAGARLTMGRDYYRRAWMDGRLGDADLAEAIAEANADVTPQALVRALDAERFPARLPLLVDALDAARDLSHAQPWRDIVTHAIGQTCAACFDEDQAAWPTVHDDSLYGAWRQEMLHEHALGLLTGVRSLHRRVEALPDGADDMIVLAFERLGLPATCWTHYCEALLASVQGWAAWCAYRRWQARLEGGSDRSLRQLLAVRLAWECLLDDGDRAPDSVHARWLRAWQGAAERLAEAEADQRIDWLWQRALEIAYQRRVIHALGAAQPVAEPQPPRVQAVFCIDVRSEVFRRALETVAPPVQTLGFAGFFGLPIAYAPLGGSEPRPQLPGLLAPALTVTDVDRRDGDSEGVARRRRRTLSEWLRGQRLAQQPGSMFGYVEAAGARYLPSLLRSQAPRPVDRCGLSDTALAQLRPQLSGDAAEDLAERILQTLGLTRNLARLVLLVGHGSRSANNPHASGLDCGACCGQTGEVNARALADLLNREEVRTALRQRGIDVPATTWFVPALHETTTDRVILFDTDALPASHADDLAQLREWLRAAGQRTRQERAPALGMAALADDPDALENAMLRRADDWAQTRPEWGLAGNAALVIAPRARSRGVDLAGRAFLHDYDWRDDTDGSVLELLMTAPMVVAHWINFQYYASTVDNVCFGSGNKLLHNVVGGRIGVFEGNGGDLRIGLPMQSVHDGERYVHEPLRLSVFIQAPRARIEAVIAEHAVVRQLVENGWLHLFRLQEDGPGIEHRRRGEWVPAASARAAE